MGAQMHVKPGTATTALQPTGESLHPDLGLHKFFMEWSMDNIGPHILLAMYPPVCMPAAFPPRSHYEPSICGVLLGGP